MPAQTVPQGYQWIRELVPNVQWDQSTKSIKLPGGLTIPSSQTLNIGGKTYVSPQQLSSWYATYQPQSTNITPEAVQRQTDIYQTVFGPLQEAYRKQIDLQLKKVQQQADAQRRLAEAAYSQAASNLQRSETGSWNAIVKSAMSRGLGASPLISYEQRKVAEAYAPEYQQLETNRAANLANITSQAAMASEELALQGMQLEAQWYSQLAQAALDALNRENEQQRQYAQQMAEYFANLGDKQNEEKWRQAQFALQEAGVTGYYQGKPTLSRQELEQQGAYQNAQLALDRLRASRSGSGGSSGGGSSADLPKTAGERAALATATLFRSAVNRYDQLRKAGYEYPLYYAVASMLRDPEWLSSARTSGADIKTAVDDLIRSRGKMTPEQYFSTPQGSKLKPYYDSLTQKQQDAINALMQAMQ